MDTATNQHLTRILPKRYMTNFGYLIGQNFLFKVMITKKKSEPLENKLDGNRPWTLGNRKWLFWFTLD